MMAASAGRIVAARRASLPTLPTLGSVPDGAETSVSTVVCDLARLSDPTSIPRLNGEIEWSRLDRSEAWAVSLVAAGMSVQAILAVSPLEDEPTLQLLAKLVSTRTITFLS
jgi:hypothetical protein